MNSLQGRYPYYIRVLNVHLMNQLYAAAEQKNVLAHIVTARREGYYELRTADKALWHDLCLYAQFIAQAQAEYVETGEDES